MKLRKYEVSSEVLTVSHEVEHEVALELERTGKISQRWLRKNQKKLKEEVFNRALDIMKQNYLDSLSIVGRD